MTKKRLSAFIANMADRAILKQAEDGSFAGGHDGPYRKKDSPVRNTAHWLFTLCSLYEQTQNQKYHTAANKAADYLLSDKARPINASFWLGIPGNNRHVGNGVIGQAWAIESLVKASRVLGRPDCYKLAEQVFLLHRFNEKTGIWNRVEQNGTSLEIDRTFNHQLWFAAAAATLYKTEAAREQALIFLEKKGQHVVLYPNGIVNHRSLMWQLPLLADYPKMPKELLRRLKALLKNKLIYKISVGYHAFNLYAFAMLKQSFPDHTFWKSQKMDRMLKVTHTVAFQNQLVGNPYGYPYNPPGIELAFAYEVFDAAFAAVAGLKWLQRQAIETYNPETGSLLSLNSPDPLTSDARIYEALRLENDYALEIP